MNRLFYDKIINMRKKNASKGLTFLEMLVVVGILVVLVAAVIFAVQPGERLAKSRDNQREVHLNTIWHAVKQKAHMEGGWENCNPLPTDYFTPIGTDADAYDLFSCLVPEYLASEVYDPLEGTLVNTKYSIWQNANTEHLSLRAQNSETRFVSAGGAGGALSFDGEDDYVSADMVNLISDRFTASVWIYPTRLEPQAEAYGNTILATSSGYGIWLLHNNGKIRIYAFSSGTARYYETTATPITLNNWFHVAVTAIRNGEGNIYVNGKFVESFTAEDDTGWSGVFGIGDLRLNRRLTHKGLIDDVRIYNRALTAGEIEQLHRGVHITDGFVGYWPLNEMQDCTANDYSGNLNHGGLGPDCPTDAPKWTTGR